MHDPLDDWDYALPEALLARTPAPRRDGSRLLRLDLQGSGLTDHTFDALPELLRQGDLLVLNDTRVLRARLHVRRASGGEVEVLLLGVGPGEVEALIRPMRKVRDGERLEVPGAGVVEVVRRDPEAGVAWVRTEPAPVEIMARAGALPLPPYLEREAGPEDDHRYQTVFARHDGSAAAPTAGLHFTPELLATLGARGVEIAWVTLHVGLGTFRNLRPEDLAAGQLHEERYHIPEATAAAVTATRARGGRVIAVGTTSTRALESATPAGERSPAPGWSSTRLLIQPPYDFRAIDGLITNFHLPRSSLMMLVGSLCGRERLLGAYQHAVASGYRFYSYGDAMLLL